MPHNHLLRVQNFEMDNDSSIDGPDESQHRQKKELQGFRLVKYRFWEALECKRCPLINKAVHYDDEAARSIAKWDKRLLVQMKSQIFGSLELISSISFISALKLTSDKNGVHEVPALWFLHFLMKCSTGAAVNAYMALRYKLHWRQKEDTITSYREAVNSFARYERHG